MVSATDVKIGLFFSNEHTSRGDTFDLGSNILTLLSLDTVASFVPSPFQFKPNT